MSGQDSRWKTAFDALPLADQELLQGDSASVFNIDDVIKLAEQRKTLGERRCTFKIAGKEIVLRDVVNRIVHWLNRFKGIVDVAIQVDPGRAGIPWAAIRLVLEVSTHVARCIPLCF